MFKNFTNECCNRECTLWLRVKLRARQVLTSPLSLMSAMQIHRCTASHAVGWCIMGWGRLRFMVREIWRLERLRCNLQCGVWESRILCGFFGCTRSNVGWGGKVVVRVVWKGNWRVRLAVGEKVSGWKMVVELRRSSWWCDQQQACWRHWKFSSGEGKDCISDVA